MGTIQEAVSYFFIMPSYPPCLAPIASFVMWGLPSSLSGSVPAIFVPYATARDWGTQR